MVNPVHITYFRKKIYSAELIDELKHILSKNNLAERDVKFIESITSQIKKVNYISPKQEKYVKDILMKYSKKYKSNNLIIELLSSKDDIAWAKQEIKKFENTPGGQWRYEGVSAWRGLVGELMVFNWFKEKYPQIIKNANLSEGIDIDPFDFSLFNFKVDIKCATEWMHAAITPKVNVCHKAPKDYYIGCKFDEREKPNKVIIMGWLPHEEIIKHPILKDKGAEYYEVPINNLYDLRILLDIFDKQSKIIKI
ncbi:hypothetical protein ACFLZ7_01955 [Nanoarchaeota archaeon]